MGWPLAVAGHEGSQKRRERLLCLLQFPFEFLIGVALELIQSIGKFEQVYRANLCVIQGLQLFLNGLVLSYRLLE